MKRDPENASTPFPVAPVSNGEWLPAADIPAKARLTEKLIAEEAAIQAKRHGMSRAQFLRTAAGTATAFWVLNEINGLPQSGEAAVIPLQRIQCEDLDAGRELLDRDMFVMDVQTHHADTQLFPGAGLCFLRFLDTQGCEQNPEILGQLNFVKETFVDSQTTVGVISGLPNGVPLGPEVMSQTRDLVNQLAGSERCLSQVMIDPKAAPGSPTAIDSMEHQVRDLGGVALKCYTYNGNWFLDDEQVSYPMLAEAQRLGLRLINCHKGLPAIFAPGSEESVRTIDLPKVVADWPKLRFCAYHSGYFQAGDHPLGLDGLSEFLQVVGGMPKSHRRRVFAEIGSTFALALLAGPDQAAHLIGQLLRALGPYNILWGTDSIWWGSPQWLIDGFKALQIPPSMQEEFGYPALTEVTKQRILGRTAARLYRVRSRNPRCSVPADGLEKLQQEQGGFRADRSLRVYGARTRREFLSIFGRG
ncbi:MAG: hypothetical protein FJ144_21080 [Deltaproteobacteria bacterium]|nr:hypothetical protein [Deltaproteobacteria bacterium]